MIKFVLVAFFKALTLQFTKAPHYVEESVTTDSGDVVNFNTGCKAQVSYVAEGTGDKRKFIINITVPAGPGLRVPASVAFADNEDRSRVANSIKEAYLKLDDSKESGIEVIVPDGANK